MTHPLQLQLKREQQISYPHINSLYLLCRSLGLIEITQIKSKRYLKENIDILNKWSKLNQTEKYFTLMHIWLFYSDERLINRGEGSPFGIVYYVINFLKDLKKPLLFKNSDEQLGSIYLLKLHNLALLEMFGIVKIRDRQGVSEKSWSIEEVSITGHGTYLLQILGNIDSRMIWLEDKLKGSEVFCQKLQIIYPECSTFLLPEKKNTDPGAYLFKVLLTKKIWRRINIQGTCFLDEFATSILDAFDFDNDHLYKFTYTDRFGNLKKISHPYLEDADTYSDEVKVGDLDVLIGDTIEFLYDFGDSWKFDIKLEKIDSQLIIPKPKIIEEEGESPEQYADYDDYE